MLLGISVSAVSLPPFKSDPNHFIPTAQAQEQDALSDADFESDDGDAVGYDVAGSDTEGAASEGHSPPTKKPRTA